MIKKLLYSLLLFPALMMGQTATENYIKTLVYKESTADVTKAKVQVTYFDGLGRPKQSVSYKATGIGGDIVTPIVYDQFGRQVKRYLPYARRGEASTLAYRNNLTQINSTIAYYQQKYPGEVTTNPYNETVFEASPLDRVLKQAAPGTDWENKPDNIDHTAKTAFLTNVDGDMVRLLKANASWDEYSGLLNTQFIDNQTYYSAGQLYKTVTKDENSASAISTSTSITSNFNTVHEFKNKQGQIILKRTFYNSEDAFGMPTYGVMDTYYVYDQYGNVTYVIPPGAGSPLTGDLCYQYKYDSRGRLVEKKIPGKQWQYYIYDKLDRLVQTGPAISPFSDLTNNGWMFTKYDAFNRIVLTGWMTSVGTINTASRKSQQSVRDLENILNESHDSSTADLTIGGVTYRYTNNSYPRTAYHVLSVNYFDDYNYPVTASVPAIPSTVEGQNVYYNNSVKPIGLATGSWIRAISTTTESRNEITQTLYDIKGRAIRSFIKNHGNTPGGFTQTDTKLDFMGKPEYTVTLHKRISSEAGVTVRENFTYSPSGLLLTRTHQVGTGPIELLTSNTYDELGSLISKNVGNNISTPLQKVDFKYNIRGWLKGINDYTNLSPAGESSDLFAYGVSYNKVNSDTEYNSKALFNGNISETYWRSTNDNVLRKYTYRYDYVNRLTRAAYQKPGSSAPVTGAYNEEIRYDSRGNILNLKRTGNTDNINAVLIDDLTYTYNTSSNLLNKVADNVTNVVGGFNDGINTGNDYSYDLNGNLIIDLNKGISGIKYNHLDLPVKITFSAGGSITYLYDANGTKLEKAVTTIGGLTTTTQYLQGFYYVNDVLQFFPTVEGYVERNPNNTFSYIYQYKDHLGNIRVSYKDNSQLLQSATFNSSSGGFVTQGTSTIGGYSNGAMLVNSTMAFDGVVNNISSTAVVGQRYRISIIIDRFTTNKLRLYLDEKNTAGVSVYTSVANIEALSNPSGSQTINFDYIVKQVLN